VERHQVVTQLELTARLLDPLNWSWTKKHLVLASLAWASLLTDFGMTYGTVLFQAQAPDFHMSVPATANSISGALFLQGPGGLLAVPLIQRFGRLPVLFWSQYVKMSRSSLGVGLSANSRLVLGSCVLSWSWEQRYHLTMRASLRSERSRVG